jgi:rare lipoprotein A
MRPLFLCLVSLSAFVPQAHAYDCRLELGQGTASWYGQKFEGRRTASGEIFSSGLMTAAHPNLPFGSMVLVTNMSNGQSAIVRVNDRGGFKKSIIDLSETAAQSIGLKQKDGLTAVSLHGCVD